MNTSEGIDVSIIIVNWNAGGYLEETINSVREKTEGIRYEIIIIDNDSDKTDESYEYIERIKGEEDIKVIKEEKNAGFAKANNIGMEMARGRNFLILNPDVIFHNNVIKILSEYLDGHEDVVMAGPKVLNADGSFQQPCLRGNPYPRDTLYHLIGLGKAFPKDARFNGYSLWHLDREKINECGALSGCCMMVKRSMYEEIGGMDEEFFMYQEETDWGLRAKETGKKVIYNPSGVVTHYQGVTTDKAGIKSKWIFTQSMMKFFKKHFWSRYNIIEKGFWIVLIYGNFILKIMQGIKRRKRKRR